ncbi:unnamed protein product [Fraxinus pennsylvanica]|uniref:Uncharacterized protein n=1 Tax=Fraxinus pennsylvanica TaxID=56036 RepID=A0AAD1ZNV9_9LAMI|nr:unnamed protein product [Fraxinus pennsylvanica]
MISDAVNKVEPDDVLSIKSFSSFETTIHVEEGMEVIFILVINCFSPTRSDYEEEEFATEGEVKNKLGEDPQHPCIPSEEEMSKDELQRMLVEQYKTRANFVTYANDGYEHKR